MNRYPIGVIALLILMPGLSSFAAEASGDSAISLAEVVVTAQRRTESLQNVPISITAFDAETLSKANITEAKDYLQFTPNIAFTEDGQTGGRSINVSIRGVSNVNLAEATTASSIGYYMDELSVGAVSNGTINPDLQDVERIEVLRGPQGTYFGRNALGGAINITTKKPDGKFYAEGEAGYSSFNTWDIGGVINLPASDKFFVRAVVKHSESDGFIKNVNPLGTRNSGYETNSFRVAARILPTDKLTVDLTVNYMDEKGGMDNSVGSGVLDLDTKSIFGPGFVPINQGGIGFYPANQRYVNHNHPEFNNNRSLILNGRITYAGDGFEVKSITGYIDSKTDRSFDQDNIGVDAINRLNHWKGKSYSEELRVQSTGDRTFEWTFGGIVSKDEFKAFNSITAGSEGSYTDENGNVIGLLPPIPNGFRINENNIVYTTKSFGLFAEGTYNISDKLGLTVGGRFTEDKIDTSNFGVVAFEGAVPDASGAGKFNNFAPRAVLKFKAAENLTTYASISRGYKTGGVDINGGVTTDFQPEKLWNYEAGFKMNLAENRIRIDGAVFYSKWTDLQVQTNYLADPNDISSAVTKTLNASSAKNKGIELEMQALVAAGLQVGVGVGYLDSKFGSFPDAVLAGGTQVDLSGKRLPKTPKLTLNGMVDYSRQITDAYQGFVRLEWVYRDTVAGNLEATAAPILGLPTFPYQDPSYSIFNFRAGVSNDNVSLNGYVENLFDKNYYNGTSDHFGLSGIRLMPHPRIFGLKVIVKTN